MSAERIDQIRNMPRSFTRAELEKWLAADGGSCRGVGESLLRAWHILDMTKRYLRLGTPAEVVLELIEVMEGPPATVGSETCKECGYQHAPGPNIVGCAKCGKLFP